MAHKDWRRYYVVVYDNPPSYQPTIWRNRADALQMLDSELSCCGMFGMAQPIGIARIRAKHDKPFIQNLLWKLAR